MDAAAMGMRWTLRMRGRDGCGTRWDATDGWVGCGDMVDLVDILDAVDHGRNQGPGDMGQCIVVT